MLVARWAPPAEKGKFVSAMMGGTLGTVVTWSLTGPLMDKFGWASAFHVPGVLTLIWCGFWWYLVADTPEDHPRITEAEKKYILEALGDNVKKSKVQIWRVIVIKHKLMTIFYTVISICSLVYEIKH